jgi:hypothetical protein
MEAFLPADCLLTPETQTLREIFSQLTSQEQTQAISHLAKLFGPQKNT